MRGWVASVGAVVAVTCALLPAAAGAADHIGMTMYPTLDTDLDPNVNPYNCLGHPPEAPQFSDTATLIQYRRQAGSLPSYTVPAGGGVITRWSHMAPDPIGFAETAALKMLRPVGGTQYKVIGQSDQETILNGPNTFPTSIPVKGGDVLGLFVQHGGNVAYCQEAAPENNTGDKTREILLTQNSPNGTTLNFSGNEQSARLSVAAVLEPDVDADGLGDETQDDSIEGVDPDTDPPETTLSGKKKFKTKRKTAKAKFTFESDEEGSTFMCRIDAKPFTECTSPAKVKARLGTHVFAVEAIDAAGNVDPTGAAKQFKVVKKKRTTRK